MSRKTIDSFTADILREVEEKEALVKQASLPQGVDVTSELGQSLVKVASELKGLISVNGDVSYDDLSTFVRSRL